jgi:mono/diheme cytochrome c family protein
MNNRTILTLTISLLASIILGACGNQAPAEPADASPPQSSDPEPAPATEVLPESKTGETEEPAEDSADTPAGEVSFANDVLPIIESRCVKCHGGDRIEEGLLMRTYDEILAGSDNGAILVPGDVEGSLLVELVATKEMPKRGPKLTPPQVQLISDWVAAGAPNN